MPTTRTRFTIVATTLLLALGAATVSAQDDDDVMGTAAAPLDGFAAVGVVLSDAGGSGDALVGVTSPAAASVVLHTTIVDEAGGAGMAPVAAIPVPAGGETVLQPMGYHLMLIDPLEPLAAGQTVDLVLEMETAGSVEASGVVVSLADVAPPAQAAAPDLPTSFTVEAYDNYYQPRTIEAPANTEIKVKLLNYGFLPHNIAFYTEEGGGLLAEDSLTSVIDPETEATLTFTTPGPGEYFILCVIHPEMTGTLVVR